MRVPGQEAADLARDAPVRVLRAVFGGIGQIVLAADNFRAQAETGEDAVDDELYEGPEALDDDAVVDGAERGSGEQKGAEETMRVGKATRSGRAQERRFRSLDATGNVRVLSAADIAELQEDMAELPPAIRELATSQDTPPATAAGPGRAKRRSAAREAKAARGQATGLRPDGSALGHGAATRSKTPAPAKSPAQKAAAQPLAVELAELPIRGYDELSLPALRSRLRGLDVDQLQVLLEYERSTANRNDVVTMFERRIVKLLAAASDAT